MGAALAAGASAPRAQVVAQASGGIGPSGTATALAQAPDMALARFVTFASVVELIRANRDVKLLVEVENHLRLVHYAPGRIEFEPTGAAPRDLAATLAQRLQSWTGARWGVSVTGSGGAPTIAETRDARTIAAAADAMQNPLVQAIFTAFPKARILRVKPPEEARVAAASAALPEVEDEWDPFEDN